MISVKHPSVLNDWQLFRQAKTINRHTNRASNPDWYKEATELDRQWHIWVDGMDVISAIYDRRSGQWLPGPEPVMPRDTGASVASQRPISKEVVHQLHDSLNEAQLEAIFANFDEDGLRRLHQTLSGLIQGKEIGGKVKSLGVVLHIADEFGISDLAPEFSSDIDFAGVRELLTTDPHEALGDQTADTVKNSWRLLPYWGVEEGERRSIAIQVTRRYQSLFFELDRYSQSHNIPIITAAYSAPLEALRIAPALLDGEASRETGDILVFQYRRFSTLAVINPEGELILIRALQHRMGQDFPASLGEILANTAASVGLPNPTVTIAAMSQVNQDNLAAELSAFFSDREPMNIGLVLPLEIDALTSLSAARAEMAVGDAGLLKRIDEASPVRGATTFRELANGWSGQNFFGISEEEKEMYPPLQDLRMLRFFGHAKMLAAALCLGLAVWTGFEYLRAATTEAWKLPDQEAGVASVELTKLERDRKRFEYWENLMARRSEGWLALEVLLQLFKPDSGLIVSESTYKVEGTVNAGATGDQKPSKIGFIRTWTIKGFSKTEGAATLAKLSSKNFLTEQFTRIADEFKVLSLMEGKETERTLDVTMQQRQGQMPPNKRFPLSVARHYRNSFEITITQTFTDKDPMALTVAPPAATPDPAAAATGAVAATEIKP
ncbi:MAG: hypothetical protein JNK37_08870 [Verrucomicrobiales bacterium]|nr:hypothetical protein [Verrucomicrobiales bacterium]